MDGSVPAGHGIPVTGNTEAPTPLRFIPGMVALPAAGLLDDLPVGLMCWDVTGDRVIYVNHTLARWVGTQPERWIGASAVATWHRLISGPFPDGDTPYPRTVMLLHPDGAHHAQLRVLDHVLAEGQVAFRTALFVAEGDGTRPGAASLLSSLPLPAALVSADDRTVVQANVPALRMARAGLPSRGLSLSSFLRSLGFLVDAPPDPGEPAACLVHQDGTPYVCLLLPVDPTRTHLAVLVPLPDSSSSPASVMMAKLAHELRNRLTTVSGHVQLLLSWAEQTGEEHVRKRAERVLAEVELVLRTVKGVLTAKRAPRRPEDLHPVDLAALTREVCEDMAGDLERRGHRLTVRVSPPCPLLANPEDLRELLVNLLQNAAQALVDPGEVEVSLSASPEQDLAVLRVRDTGQGIPPDALPHIFEPFFTTKPGGTGLGLTVCQAIVRQMGGRMIADSHPGAGTTFTVILPTRLAKEHGP